MLQVSAIAGVLALSLLAAGFLYALIVGVFAAILDEAMSLLLILGSVN